MPKQLPPAVLQLVGLALVVGGAVFWGVTGRSSPELISAGMALAAGGLISAATKKNGTSPPPPPSGAT